jgi:hypothetical protein
LGIIREKGEAKQKLRYSNEGNTMTDPKRARQSSVILLVLLFGLLSCHKQPQTNNSGQEGLLSFNLSAITGPAQSQVFSEVKRASLLPKAVLDHFEHGIADPGQPFNTTDAGDPKLPRNLLVVAAVSKQYCIVTYWQGGIVIEFQTSIFELSEGKAKLIWLSHSQGGLNFRDLKAMVESGRMHNDLDKKL